MGRVRAVAVLAGLGMAAYWAGEAAEVRVPRLFGWMAGLSLGVEYVSLSFVMGALAMVGAQLVWERNRRPGWWKRALLVAGAATLLAPLGLALGQRSLVSVAAAMAVAGSLWTALGQHARDRSAGTGNIVPALVVSLCVQVGVGLMAAERLAEAAALAAFGTWMFLWGRKRKGWVRTRQEAERWPVGVRVAAMLGLAVFLSALAVVRYPPPPLQAQKKSTGAGSGAAREAEKGEDLMGTVGGGDWPGVVVHPEAERHAVLVPPLPKLRTDPFGRKQSRLDPVSIPFFGAYWYFRPPDERPPDGSPILRGTPERMRFLTWDEGPIQMEARQNLSTFIDLAGCAAVQLSIRNADGYPGTVWMKLLLADTKKLVEWDLGEQEVRSVARWRPGQSDSTEETLTFALEGVGALTRFDEFRVVYRMKQMRWGRSAKVAIMRFVLLPQTGLAGPV
ncbi:MAG: hypothetical protein J0L64_07345 [Acidobacteria bacterium]|nr:hypothetical protein [Acidobacteriota bacterium]